MVAPALAALLVAGCFNFGATVAGGPLDDGGVKVLPGEDGGLDDGAPPPGDDSSDGATTADGTVGVAESGPPESGLTDAGVADSHIDGGYCASLAHPGVTTFFCDDFDERALPGDWQTWASTGGSLLETNDASVSPSTSIDELTKAVTNGQAVNVALRTPMKVPTLPSTVTFSYALQPVSIDTTTGAAIVLGAIDFLDDAGNRYSIGLAINVSNGLPALALGEQTGVIDGGNLPDGGPPTYTPHPLPPTEPLAMRQWSTIEVELNWSASTFEGKVIVNGTTELDTDLTMTVVPTSLQIGVGTSYVTEYTTMASPIWEMRYDNVVYTAN
jgi:hypothetical protein